MNNGLKQTGRIDFYSRLNGYVEEILDETVIDKTSAWNNLIRYRDFFDGDFRQALKKQFPDKIESLRKFIVQYYLAFVTAPEMSLLDDFNLVAEQNFTEIVSYVVEEFKYDGNPTQNEIFELIAKLYSYKELVKKDNIEQIIEQILSLLIVQPPKEN